MSVTAKICVIAAAMLFAALGVLFLFGRATMLIAGYNTMSHDEREKYDRKKLCKVAGISTLIISAALLITGLDDFGGASTYVFIAVCIASVTTTMILSNTVCRKK